MRLVSDRAVLSRAKTSDLIRLARFVGIKVKRDPCKCYKCATGLIEVLARVIPKL
jgi:hypothetical protein